MARRSEHEGLFGSTLMHCKTRHLPQNSSAANEVLNVLDISLSGPPALGSRGINGWKERSREQALDFASSFDVTVFSFSSTRLPTSKMFVAIYLFKFSFKEQVQISVLIELTFLSSLLSLLNSPTSENKNTSHSPISLVKAGFHRRSSHRKSSYSRVLSFIYRTSLLHS